MIKYNKGDNFRSDPPSLINIIKEVQDEVARAAELRKRRVEIKSELGRRTLSIETLLMLINKANDRHKSNTTKKNKWFLYGMTKALKRTTENEGDGWSMSLPQFNLLCLLAGISQRQAQQL